MSVDICLVRRQDLIMRAIDALAFPYHDKVTLQVLISLENFHTWNPLDRTKWWRPSPLALRNLSKREAKLAEEWTQGIQCDWLCKYTSVLHLTGVLHTTQSSRITTMSRFYPVFPSLSPDLVVQGETLDGVTQILGDSGLETIKAHGGFLLSFPLSAWPSACRRFDRIDLFDRSELSSCSRVRENSNPSADLCLPVCLSLIRTLTFSLKLRRLP